MAVAVFPEIRHHENSTSLPFGFRPFVWFVFLFTSFSYVLLQRRLLEVSLPGYWHNDSEKMSDGGPEYCIDAVSVGNVARFINHSCQPNLFVQCVLSTHHDIGLARVVLMAADNIPPLQVSAKSYSLCVQ